MNVKWMKCQGEVWCPLSTVNLSHAHFNDMEGVYVVWHGGSNPATVRIGQGIIKERLATHRVDPDVQAFANFGLFVTWASIPGMYRDGVEVFLATRLKPKVGDRFPNAQPIEVNLPW